MYLINWKIIHTEPLLYILNFVLSTISVVRLRPILTAISLKVMALLYILMDIYPLTHNYWFTEGGTTSRGCGSLWWPPCSWAGSGTKWTCDTLRGVQRHCLAIQLYLFLATYWTGSKWGISLVSRCLLTHPYIYFFGFLEFWKTYWAHSHASGFYSSQSTELMSSWRIKSNQVAFFLCLRLLDIKMCCEA